MIVVVLCIAGAWTFVAVVVALAVGRAIALSDSDELP